ncbi:unnamed protein product [Mytilus coruscus]|uniref:Reverse transcriptase domain-containing protein n=1 Tax=Mytilus coruscus TaxID=42192 RepID=A0A6J8BG11_MYTCO|nr:unnamed protein product [Mytilus coruscus]
MVKYFECRTESHRTKIQTKSHWNHVVLKEKDALGEALKIFTYFSQTEKKKLRSQQRQEYVSDRRKPNEQIMDNPSTELFYKLINRNKTKSRTETSVMEIDGEFDFSTQNQSRTFANCYYEDLSIPKESSFDNYLELCQIRQKIVEETFSQNMPSIDPYTEKEIKQAVENLNTGKSPDEHGICAEHLKYLNTGKSSDEHGICAEHLKYLNTGKSSDEHGICAEHLKYLNTGKFSDEHGIYEHGICAEHLKYLNTGKSSDEHGICAEHLKYSNTGKSSDEHGICAEHLKYLNTGKSSDEHGICAEHLKYLNTGKSSDEHGICAEHLKYLNTGKSSDEHGICAEHLKYLNTGKSSDEHGICAEHLKYLNTGKSSDEHGICAEHLKYLNTGKSSDEHGICAEHLKYLNTGKSSDEHGICAEHLKFAQHTVVPTLTKIFNKILQERKVPVDFKSGILTPVLKKVKNPYLVNSYRGITVTPVLSKLHEFCILGKLSINSGTDLQFGFTEGLWPLFESFIISECKCEMISNALSLYLATVDVQSAFDVVHHTKLLDSGTRPDICLEKTLRSTIYKYWTSELQETADTKSSLKFLNITILEIGNVHPVWEYASQNLLDVGKSMIKARMLTGTYLVQADKFTFSQYKVNATCLLCHREDEDLTHVLTFCPTLRVMHMQYFLPLKDLITSIIGCKKWEELFNSNQDITALLLDFSVFCDLQNLSKSQR